MNDHDSTGFTGDRALKDPVDDKLGFRTVAQRLARSLLDDGLKNGYVVGIEGEWGSGKSSLLFLITKELEHLPQDQRPSIINFRPWLIGNRDALLALLFGELSEELDSVAEERSSSTAFKERAETARNALRSFMAGISKAGAAIERLADASGVQSLKIIAKSVNAVKAILEGKETPPQLSILKNKLVEALENLDHRFIITIDDVDRLDPREVIEILRLVRSVADLPNVVYVLLYDRRILSESIEGVGNIKSGEHYLEKIIQLTVMVPIPEPFRLREWFSRDLEEIASVKNSDELYRLRVAIDFEGGRRLETPRSVVRALDAMRFYWPSLREAGADLPDLVWLQLIKDSNPKLYRWIENYCATYSVLSIGSAVDQEDRAKDFDQLMEIIPEGWFRNVTYRLHFAEILPGVSIDYGQDNATFSLYGGMSDEERDAAISGRRLSSPDHYSFYFSLGSPSHAITQNEFSILLRAAGQGQSEMEYELMQLNVRVEGSRLSKVELLLDRLVNFQVSDLSEKQVHNIMMGFAQVADVIYENLPARDLFSSTIWDRAERLISAFLQGREPDWRAPLIQEMFENGAAIGWLTNMFRREVFAHGWFGDSSRPESQWLFTETELENVQKIMLRRYRMMTSQEIFSSPDALSILYAWSQAGEDEEVRECVQNHAESNGGLIDALESLMTTIESSDRGRFKVLKQENLERFLDPSMVASRVESLTGDPELGDRAKKISKAFRLAKEY